MEDLNIAYSAKGLVKTFPGVLAIDNIDIDVKKGEIHGIIGKNGAGKSVLMSLIAGTDKSDSGTLSVHNSAIDIKSYNPSKAIKEGIILIPQEPLIAQHMTIVDNLFLNSEMENYFGLLDSRGMKKRTDEIIDDLGLDVSHNSIMGEIHLEEQQLLTLGKALYINRAKIILLDEITASLPKDQKKVLLNLIKSKINEDPELSFTLISHHINEIIDFCDKVTVLRDGKAITTLKISSTNSKELSDLIVGKTQQTITNRPSYQNFEESNKDKIPLFEIRGLGSKEKFLPVDFRLYKGQVIGLAGLDGSGKHDFLESLAGLIPTDSGEILIEGKKVTIDNPRRAINNGISYLPRKREEEAVIHNRSVYDNILLSVFNKFSNFLNFIDFKVTRKFAEESINRFKIKTPSQKTNIDNLSGGNRQKVILNRIYANKSKIYILNEPTRGVDLSAKPEILSVIRNEFTETGGVIFTSESEEELLEISDKVLVFYKGKIEKIFNKNDEDFNFEEVYKSSQGVDLS